MLIYKESLKTGLGFSDPRYIRYTVASWKSKHLFPQLTDVKALLADDKAPLAVNMSPFVHRPPYL